GGNRMLAKHQVLVPALVIVGAMVALFVLNPSASNLLARGASFGAFGTDRTAQWRTEMGGAAIAMFVKSPLSGFGLGSFPLFASYLGAPALPVVAGRLPSLGEMAHNQYLQILAETGIVGLLLYLAIPIAFFIHCGRALRARVNQTRKW